MVRHIHTCRTAIGKYPFPNNPRLLAAIYVLYLNAAHDTECLSALYFYQTNTDFAARNGKRIFTNCSKYLKSVVVSLLARLVVEEDRRLGNLLRLTIHRPLIGCEHAER